MRNWKKWEIKTIDRESSEFPKKLKQISNCPKKLYYRGKWDETLFKKTLSIVGSRRMSRYGREVVGKFMPDLVGNKITIISGFMYGIDSEAHRQCLGFDGKTVAVFGGGLDVLPVAENDNLYLEILEKGGLVISEYEPDFKPTLWSFPQRNRIVAGLSTLGVLVIEASLKSGSLITARLGRQQGKNVYAIPGQIDCSTAIGVNWLIKNNQAKMVTEIEDILEKINKIETKQEELFADNFNGVEKKIIETLEQERSTIDELARKLNLSVAEVSAKVSLLSMKGLIEEEAGKIYLTAVSRSIIR